MVYTPSFAKRLQVGRRSLEVILGNGSCSWWVSHKQPTRFPYGVAGKCLIIWRFLRKPRISDGCAFGLALASSPVPLFPA